MSDSSVPIQRLRLNRATLEDLVKDIDRITGGNPGTVARAERRPVHRPGVLIQSPKGELPTRHEVYIRNVSASGAAMLHTSFLKPQHNCMLVLVKECREAVTIEATVVRCQHVSGHIHDVAVRFVRELTKEEADGICIIPGSAQSMVHMPPMQLAETVSKCKELAGQLHELVESGASTEQLLPLIDELRLIDPGDMKAA